MKGSVAVVNGRVLHAGASEPEDVEILIEDGVVTRLAETLGKESADEVIDADGATVLPGGIDAHVHFREPGATHKEDWGTGSRSAVAGGVTTVVDQPNTQPPTIDGGAFDEKRALASKSVTDYGINAGVTEDWKPEELFDRPVCAYGEVFMADSTGEMGIDASLFETAVRRITNRGEVTTVHAEDSGEFVGVDLETHDTDVWSRHRPPEAEVEAVKKAVELTDEPIHFAHISHPRSVDIIKDTRHTCEVTPHHLVLSRDDLDRLGTYGKMNPPLRSEGARRELFDRLTDGTVDVVATDHAPHRASEKDAPVGGAPSGVPGVETVYPILLGLSFRGEVSLSRVVELIASEPARVFGFEDKGEIREGNDADLTFIKESFEEIRPEGLHSRCEWTPYEGFEAVFPRLTMRRGQVVYENTDEKDRERFADGGGRLLC